VNNSANIHPNDQMSIDGQYDIPVIKTKSDETLLNTSFNHTEIL